MDIPANIKMLAEKRGMTLKDLAKAIGVPNENIYRITNRGERGRPYPDAWTLHCISKALRCSLKDLFYLDERIKQSMNIEE